MSRAPSDHLILIMDFEVPITIKHTQLRYYYKVRHEVKEDKMDGILLNEFWPSKSFNAVAKELDLVKYIKIYKDDFTDVARFLKIEEPDEQEDY